MIDNIETQVCSLYLSKKLEQLGVKQESEFFWIIKDNKKEVFWKYSKEEWENNYSKRLPGCKFHSAFTVAELGDMLKGKISFPYWYKGYWIYSNENANIPNDGCITIKEDNEADARALLLIHLLENCYIDLEDIGS